MQKDEAIEKLTESIAHDLGFIIYRNGLYSYDKLKNSNILTNSFNRLDNLFEQPILQKLTNKQYLAFKRSLEAQGIVENGLINRPIYLSELFASLKLSGLPLHKIKKNHILRIFRIVLIKKQKQYH